LIADTHFSQRAAENQSWVAEASGVTDTVLMPVLTSGMPSMQDVEGSRRIEECVDADVHPVALLERRNGDRAKTGCCIEQLKSEVSPSRATCEIEYATQSQAQALPT